MATFNALGGRGSSRRRRHVPRTARNLIFFLCVLLPLSSRPGAELRTAFQCDLHLFYFVYRRSGLWFHVSARRRQVCGLPDHLEEERISKEGPNLRYDSVILLAFDRRYIG